MAALDPAKIAQFLSNADITGKPGWKELVSNLENAELFAIECRPYAVGTRDDGTFKGRANLQINGVSTGRSNAKVSASYDVSVQINGHAEGDKLFVDNIELN